MLLVDLNYNFECDWFVELSDNKLSDNNLASELEGNRSFFKPITIEEIVIFIIIIIIIIIIIYYLFFFFFKLSEEEMLKLKIKLLREELISKRKLLHQGNNQYSNSIVIKLGLS